MDLNVEVTYNANRLGASGSDIFENSLEKVVKSFLFIGIPSRAGVAVQAINQETLITITS